jgi:hypothetical protein
MPPLFQHMLDQPFPSQAPVGAFGAPGALMPGMLPGMQRY